MAFVPEWRHEADAKSSTPAERKAVPNWLYNWLADKTYSFPPQLRLRKPSEYKEVFTRPVKSSDAYFTLLAVRNDLNHPRLGLAIAKKVIKKAVDRNMLKRTARESFRLQQHKLINIDVVVMARKDALEASPEKLQKSLERHWLRLVNRCESYS